MADNDSISPVPPHGCWLVVVKDSEENKEHPRHTRPEDKVRRNARTMMGKREDAGLVSCRYDEHCTSMGRGELGGDEGQAATG